MPRERVIFTKEMKREYTILLPDMLPMHFKILERVFRSYGYKAVLLTNNDHTLTDGAIVFEKVLM